MKTGESITKCSTFHSIQTIFTSSCFVLFTEKAKIFSNTPAAFKGKSFDTLQHFLGFLQAICGKGILCFSLSCWRKQLPCWWLKLKRKNARSKELWVNPFLHWSSQVCQSRSSRYWTSAARLLIFSSTTILNPILLIIGTVQRAASKDWCCGWDALWYRSKSGQKWERGIQWFPLQWL